MFRVERIKGNPYQTSVGSISSTLNSRQGAFDRMSQSLKELGEQVREKRLIEKADWSKLTPLERLKHAEDAKVSQAFTNNLTNQVKLSEQIRANKAREDEEENRLDFMKQKAEDDRQQQLKVIRENFNNSLAKIKLSGDIQDRITTKQIQSRERLAREREKGENTRTFARINSRSRENSLNRNLQALLARERERGNNFRTLAQINSRAKEAALSRNFKAELVRENFRQQRILNSEKHTQLWNLKAFDAENKIRIDNNRFAHEDKLSSRKMDLLKQRYKHEDKLANKKLTLLHEKIKENKKSTAENKEQIMREASELADIGLALKASPKDRNMLARKKQLQFSLASKLKGLGLTGRTTEQLLEIKKQNDDNSLKKITDQRKSTLSRMKQLGLDNSNFTVNDIDRLGSIINKVYKNRNTGELQIKTRNKDGKIVVKTVNISNGRLKSY